MVQGKVLMKVWLFMQFPAFASGFGDSDVGFQMFWEL